MSEYENTAQRCNTRQQTAHDALRETISTLQIRTNRLEALLRALPAELPLVADEALQVLVLEASNRR